MLEPHTAEDWCRLYSLVRYHHGSVTQGAEGPKATSHGPMNLNAQPPNSLTDADFRASAVNEKDDDDGERITDIEFDIEPLEVAVEDNHDKAYGEGA